MPKLYSFFVLISQSNRISSFSGSPPNLTLNLSFSIISVYLQKLLFHFKAYFIIFPHSICFHKNNFFACNYYSTARYFRTSFNSTILILFAIISPAIPSSTSSFLSFRLLSKTKQISSPMSVSRIVEFSWNWNWFKTKLSELLTDELFT